MSRIQTTFTSDDRSIQQALMLMQARMEKLVEKQRKLADEAKQGGRTAVKAAEANEKAIYQLQLATLKLQSQEERRAAASKRQDDEAKRRVEEHTRKLQEQARVHQQAANAARGYIADQISGVKSMILQYGSLASAIGFATRALQEHRAEQLRKGETSDEHNKKVIKGLALAGDLQNAPALIERQESHPTATREQVQAAQEGVRGAAPSMPTERFADISDQAARVAPLFRGDAAAIQALGEAAGEIADTLPDLKPADAVDLALSLQQKAGADLEKVADPSFQRATKILRETKAVDDVEALSIGIEALDANLDPKSVEKLASKLTEDIKVPKLPANRALTESERAYRAYAQEKDTGKRLEMLRGNEGLQQKVLGDQLANKFREINFDKALQRAQTLRQDMGRDYVGEQVKLLEKTPKGREALQAQKIAKRRDVVARDEEEYGRALKRSQDKLDELNEDDGAGAMKRAWRKFDFWVRSWTASTPEEALQGTMQQGVPGTPLQRDDPRLKDFSEVEQKIASEQRAHRGEPEPYKFDVPDFVRETNPQVGQIEWVIDKIRGLFGGTPEPAPPIIDAKPPAVPPRPKVELPEAPPPRLNRQPAPLGPTMEERRRSFEREQGAKAPGRRDAEGNRIAAAPVPPAPAATAEAGPRFYGPPLLPAAMASVLASTPQEQTEPLAPERPQDVTLSAPAATVEPLAPIHLAAPEVTIDTPLVNINAPPRETIDVPAPAVTIARPEETDVSVAEPAAARPPRVGDPLPWEVLRDAGQRLWDSLPDFSQLPDYLPDLRQLTPEREPVEIKLPRPDAASSVAEQLAGLARQVIAPAPAAGMDAALPVLRRMADALGELIELGRQTRDNTAQLTERRVSAGVVPLAAVRRDRNRHGERG